MKKRNLILFKYLLRSRRRSLRAYRFEHYGFFRNIKWFNFYDKSNFIKLLNYKILLSRISGRFFDKKLSVSTFLKNRFGKIRPFLWWLNFNWPLAWIRNFTVSFNFRWFLRMPFSKPYINSFFLPVNLSDKLNLFNLFSVDNSLNFYGVKIRSDVSHLTDVIFKKDVRVINFLKQNFDCFSFFSNLFGFWRKNYVLGDWYFFHVSKSALFFLLKIKTSDVNWLFKRHPIWLNNKTWLLNELNHHEIRLGTIKRALGYKERRWYLLLNDIGNFFKNLNSHSTFFYESSRNSFRRNFLNDFNRKYLSVKKRLLKLSRKFYKFSCDSFLVKPSKIKNDFFMRNYMKSNKKNQLFLLNSVNLNRFWFNTNFVISWKSVFSNSTFNAFKSPFWVEDLTLYEIFYKQVDIKVPRRRIFFPSSWLFFNSIIHTRRYKWYETKSLSRYNSNFRYYSKYGRFHKFSILFLFSLLKFNLPFNLYSYFAYWIRSSIFMSLLSFFFVEFSHFISPRLRQFEQVVNDSSVTTFFKNDLNLFSFVPFGYYFYNLFTFYKFSIKQFNLFWFFFKSQSRKFISNKSMLIYNISLNKFNVLNNRLNYFLGVKALSIYRSFWVLRYLQLKNHSVSYKHMFLLLKLFRYSRPYWYVRRIINYKIWFRQYWVLKKLTNQSIVSSAKFVYFWL